MMVFLTAVAIVAGLLAIGALQNLSADYQDSPDSTYLEIDLPLLALSAGAAISVFTLWRDR